MEREEIMNSNNEIFGIPIEYWQIAIDEAIGSSPDSPPDSFNFNSDAEALSFIINTCNTPLTIGIHGAWGTGKTSLMRLLQNLLEEKYNNSIETIWFDVLHYEDYKPLWGVFLVQIFDQLIKKYQEKVIPKTGKLRWIYKIKSKLTPIRGPYGKLERLKSWFSSLESLSLTFQYDRINFGFNISERYSKNSFEEFMFSQRERITISQKFSNLVQDILGKKGRVVIFIDNLDRLSPDRILPALEDFKRFLNIKGCIYVIGIEQELIGLGFKRRFPKWNLQAENKLDGQSFETIDHSIPKLYLEKYIQVPYSLRKPEGLAITYLKDNYPQFEIIFDEEDDFFTEEVKEKLRDVLEYIAKAHNYNPRRVKVFFNTLILILVLEYNRLRIEGYSRLDDIDKLIDLIVLHFIYTSDPNLISIIRSCSDNSLDTLELTPHNQVKGIINLILKQEDTIDWLNQLKRRISDNEWYFRIPQMKIPLYYLTDILSRYLRDLQIQIDSIDGYSSYFGLGKKRLNLNLVKMPSGDVTDIFDVLSNPNHSVILGGRGSGKSTLLRTIAAAAASNIIDTPKMSEKSIPFLLNFRYIHDSELSYLNMEDLIKNFSIFSSSKGFSDIFDHCLEQGTGLVLIDDLDLFSKAESLSIRFSKLEVFLTNYTQWRVILAVNETSYKIPKFKESIKRILEKKYTLFRINPLTFKQFSETLQNYLDYLNITQLQKETIFNKLKDKDWTPRQLLSYLDECLEEKQENKENLNDLLK